ncbi:MAG: DUF2852 domain-containing protein, partial [Devosiaceae bacterium]|nr:DUF2852 domain-containing protein [Devosiaceae bacterium]
EVREEQLKHLEEERRRLDDEIANFGEYMSNLHKARDREEFDSYMNSRPNNFNDDAGGADFSTDSSAQTRKTKKK